ncbi:hypothetical protein VNI00_014091 [Paramarasmius palmivorus]|uniref:Transmembrane protein n=1 Tax=Paramarasmius palmivorus TaxID=297713 RepID=A0AAW0BVA7_9AGAR
MNWVPWILVYLLHYSVVNAIPWQGQGRKDNKTFHRPPNCGNNCDRRPANGNQDHRPEENAPTVPVASPPPKPTDVERPTSTQGNSEAQSTNTNPPTSTQSSSPESTLGSSLSGFTNMASTNGQNIESTLIATSTRPVTTRAVPSIPTNSPSPSETPTGSSSRSGPSKSTIMIVATILGVLALITFFTVITLFLRRRRYINQNRTSISTSRSRFFNRDRMTKAPSFRARKSAVPTSISRTSMSTSTWAPSWTAASISAPRTERLSNIDAQIQELQAELMRLPRAHISPEEIEHREKIGRLQAWRDGEWASQKTDEKRWGLS